MAEPHITASGAAVGLAAAPPLLFLGAPVDSLVLGLASAILVTLWLEQIDNRMKSAAAMLLSALLAGYGSPVAAEVATGLLAAHLPSVSLDGHALRMLCAACIGAAAPYLVPVVIRRAGRQIQGPVQ